MHQVLLLDELLRLIFAHIDDNGNPKAALAAFARLAVVCRAWNDPASDFLWDSLLAVDPLFALLPTVIRTNDTLVRIFLMTRHLEYSHATADGHRRRIGRLSCPLPIIRFAGTKRTAQRPSHSSDSVYHSLSALA